MEAMHTMPELGFQKKATDAAFASNVLESLDDIYNSRNVCLSLASFYLSLALRHFDVCSEPTEFENRSISSL